MQERTVRIALYAAMLVFLLLARRALELFGIHIDRTAALVGSVPVIFATISLLFLEMGPRDAMEQRVFNMKRMVFAVMAAVEAWLIWNFPQGGDVGAFAAGQVVIGVTAFVFRHQTSKMLEPQPRP